MSGAGDARRRREREAAAREAAAPTTAARWLVLAPAASPVPVVPVDVVGELLALDPRTTLRSRDGDRLRQLAGHVTELVGAGATCPSGVPLLDLVEPDPDRRQQLLPDLDVAALLADDGPRRTTMDRTIRLADALVARAGEHRKGVRDLASAVAPPLPRHPLAGAVEAVVAIATEQRLLPASPAPAIAEAADGWVAASPFEVFVAASSGALRGGEAELGGEVLARWFDGWVRGPDPWRQALVDRVPVDADGLLRDAAGRAGSDHPEVLAGPLVELIAARHPGGAS